MTDDAISRAAAIAAIESDGEFVRSIGLANRLRALPSVEPTGAAQVGVKPLEWRFSEASKAHRADADVTGEIYLVWEDEKDHWVLSGKYHSSTSPSLEAAKAAAQADYEARILSALDMQPTVKPLVEAERFEKADWYWRAADPDDCGDSPEEAVNCGMLGRFCVCEIASSYIGPTRYGFIAPVLDPESDDEEFVHFDTHEEAMAAAKARAALAEIKGESHE